MEKLKNFLGVVFIFMISFLLLRKEVYSEAAVSPDQSFWRESDLALEEMQRYFEEHPEEFEDEDKEELPEVIEKPKFIVTATIYNPTIGQCDESPLVTADRSKIDLEKLENGELKWIAVSRDLLKYFKYGDKVKLSGNDKIAGTYEIHDTMNKRYTNYIDILMPESIKLGKWKNITIEKVD